MTAAELTFRALVVPSISIPIILRTRANWSVRPSLIASAVLVTIASFITVPLTGVFIESAQCQPPYVAGEDIRLYAGRAYAHREAGCPK